jgi:hypothetical protein
MALSEFQGYNLHGRLFYVHYSKVVLCLLDFVLEACMR